MKHIYTFLFVVIVSVVSGLVQGETYLKCHQTHKYLKLVPWHIVLPDNLEQGELFRATHTPGNEWRDFRLSRVTDEKIEGFGFNSTDCEGVPCLMTLDIDRVTGYSIWYWRLTKKQQLEIYGKYTDSDGHSYAAYCEKSAKRF